MSSVIYALVERGVLLRPALALELRGCILLRLGDPYKPVRVDCYEGEIEVGDCEDDDRAHDLVIDGALHDFIALVASPLTGGLPTPTTATGRTALARLLDGRIRLSGPPNLARKLLRLLSAMPESGRTATPRATRDRKPQIARRWPGRRRVVAPSPRRMLIISGAHEILAASLAERVRQLLSRGWVEQRYNDVDTGEHEWWLTDSGRDAQR